MTSSIFQPRPKQAEVLAYTGGTMGVAAVPGSGKTWTLSKLAAELIASGVLQEEQEILIVTLVNSAVDNFAQRVGGFVQEHGLFPRLGYRVRTLHGLAHHIVRERPGLVGLADDFQIIDERAAAMILNEVCAAWLRANQHVLEDYIEPGLLGDENKVAWLLRDKIPPMVVSAGRNFIRYAKDLELTPERVRTRLDLLPMPLRLAEMGLQIYQDYQRALAYRGAVDFSDLIRLALLALRTDEDFCERLRYRWPYILEDEAQDSSLLQEQILLKLSGPAGNWVRVGDPNQAIFETFTTADPRHLRRFIAGAQYRRSLPNSGRSTLSIIKLANYFINWTANEHPTIEVRDGLGLPLIEPAPPGDPQPNPLDQPAEIHLVGQRFTPAEELQQVARSIARWLPEHPDKTLAVLVPRNKRGFDIVDQLRRMDVPVVDTLLQSSTSTRAAAGAMAWVLKYLADPTSIKLMARVYEVWRRDFRTDEEALLLVKRVKKQIQNLQYAEDFVWPQHGRDWLAEIHLNGTDDELISELTAFRSLLQRWQGAVLLPIDQLILMLAQDLFHENAELALAHKLAVVLGRAARENPYWQLPDLNRELEVIAKNQRKFLGFSDDDLAFLPENFKGQAVVVTMHKAKGLEWDRVYLMSVNNYSFPSGELNDSYMPEKWFIRDQLNLEAEVLAQLETVVDPQQAAYHEGAATQKSRLDYVRERLRLLYVGITRAREQLVITWNTGQKGDQYQAVPFVALQTHWEVEHGDTSG